MKPNNEPSFCDILSWHNDDDDALRATFGDLAVFMEEKGYRFIELVQIPDPKHKRTEFAFRKGENQ